MRGKAPPEWQRTNDKEKPKHKSNHIELCSLTSSYWPEIFKSKGTKAAMEALLQGALFRLPHQEAALLVPRVRVLRCEDCEEDRGNAGAGAGSVCLHCGANLGEQ